MIMTNSIFQEKVKEILGKNEEELIVISVDNVIESLELDVSELEENVQEKLKELNITDSVMTHVVEVDFDTINYVALIEKDEEIKLLLIMNNSETKIFNV